MTFRYVARARHALVAALFMSLAAFAALEAQTPRPYRILVTNDDGIRAPGLAALVETLAPLGDVIVVAPLENHSGTGHAINLSGPIYVEQVQVPGAQSATGLATTPASAVRVALTTLLDAPPDLLVSGINPGFNFGLNAYISGTLGAAREGAMRGVASIAVSQDIRAGRNFGPAAAVAAQVASIVKNGGLPKGVFLNVSVPRGTAAEIKGLKLARQSRMMGSERFEESKTASGRRLFWPVFEQPTSAEPGSDIQIVLDGYVAITPLRAYEGDDAALAALEKQVGQR